MSGPLKIAVVGGGPSGAFFAILARKRAVQAGKSLEITIFVKGGFSRIHLGPYANQNEARISAEGLQGRLGFKPMVNLR